MYQRKFKLNIKLCMTVLRGEEPHSTKGDPIGAEQYGSRIEGP